MAVVPASATLVQRIVDLLRTPGNTRDLNFRVAGTAYRSQGYLAVGNAVRDGKISVLVDTDPRYKGSNVFTYNEEQNALYLSTGFTGNRDQYDATIVHEATHAVEDGSKWNNMTLVDTEVAGYVAQFLFLIGRSAVPAFDPTDATGLIFSEAKKAADAVMCSMDGSFPEDGLRRAIAAHPEYSGRLNTPVMNAGY